jgi:RNA polymerase sigma factor (sigma-70 family)
MAGIGMTDGELLQRYLAGDRRALEELVRRHVDFVYAAARRQTGDPHQADDVTQAVFMLLARKAASVRPEHLSGWLFSVTRYAVANATRLAARRTYHESRAALQRTEQIMPNDNAEPNPLLPQLDDALAELPSKDREVVILRYLRGKSIAEVCTILGSS